MTNGFGEYPDNPITKMNAKIIVAVYADGTAQVFAHEGEESLNSIIKVRKRIALPTSNQRSCYRLRCLI
jgi:hypothetical protein